MNTSTCSLNTVNKNKNKKSRLTPDLEVKGIKNTKVGCSPGPSLKNKNNLDDNLYNKSDNTEKANDKTFHCSTKIKNFRLKETNKKDNKKQVTPNHFIIHMVKTAFIPSMNGREFCRNFLK